MNYLVWSDEIRDRFIAELLTNPYKYTAEIIPVKKTRTLPQNKLYHKIKGIIAPHTGYDTDTLHELFKCQFLGLRELEFNGKLHTLPKTTTSLSTKEFGLFLDKVYAAGYDLGLKLPTKGWYGYDLHDISRQ